MQMKCSLLLFYRNNKTNLDNFRKLSWGCHFHDKKKKKNYIFFKNEIPKIALNANWFIRNKQLLDDTEFALLINMDVNKKKKVNKIKRTLTTKTYRRHGQY